MTFSSNRIGFLTFLITFQLSFSQSDLGTWNIFNFNAKFDKKWSSFAEAQLRSLSFYDQFHYYEYKVGINYAAANNFVATTGIGSYNTFDEGGNFIRPMQNQEVRTWLQFGIKTPIERLIFDNRLRFEQRFTSNGYRNRYRLRIGATMPINNKKIVRKTLSAIAWNEIFFTNREPYFERNRLFVGLGYEFEDFSVQSGYIRQFDYRINDETGRSFFNFVILYHVDFSKEKQFQSSTVD